MLAHQSGDALSLRCWSHHIATITYVCTQTRLIGLDEVCAEDLPLRVARYESLCRQVYPGFPHLLLGTVRRERISVACADRLLQDWPGNRPVRLAILTNPEHALKQTQNGAPALHGVCLRLTFAQAQG